jgi:hypothetical protein
MSSYPECPAAASTIKAAIMIATALLLLTASPIASKCVPKYHELLCPSL